MLGLGLGLGLGFNWGETGIGCSNPIPHPLSPNPNPNPNPNIHNQPLSIPYYLLFLLDYYPDVCGTKNTTRKTDLNQEINYIYIYIQEINYIYICV